MTKISRLDMGAYLCIASNSVPPTVSKRIKVSVDCKYKSRNQLILKLISLPNVNPIEAISDIDWN